MKNLIFGLMVTVAANAVSPVMAMESNEAIQEESRGGIIATPMIGDEESQASPRTLKKQRDAERLEKISELKKAKEELSKEFYELALNRNYEDPSQVLKMYNLETQILIRKRSILNLVSEMECFVFTNKKLLNQRKLQDFHTAVRIIREGSKATYQGNSLEYFEYNSWILRDVVFGITPERQNGDRK